MAAAYDQIQEWFWNEDFWLPHNVTWADLERNESIFIPYARDLWVPLPLAVVLFLMRLLWERFVATPIGRYYGVKENPPRPPAKSPILEKAYKEHRRVLPKYDGVVGLAKQCDWAPRQVERWWRRRRVQGKPSEMQRFRETSWRFLFYFSAFVYGLVVLWDKPWFWDTKHCWYGYPKQHISSDIYWYYMIELSFYWSLVISLTIDNKRKDFTEMMVHHFATILLMVLSWSDNMVRVGTLVLVVHDAVDPIMEFAKCCKYCKFEKLTDGLFVLFTIMWFVTRICIYPFRVIKCSALESVAIIGPFGSFYIFNGLLLVLQVLHIIWFYMILRMAHEFIIKGQVDKDDRSETEPDSSSDEDKRRIVANGKPGVNGNNNVRNGVLETKNGVQDKKAV